MRSKTWTKLYTNAMRAAVIVVLAAIVSFVVLLLFNLFTGAPTRTGAAQPVATRQTPQQPAAASAGGAAQTAGSADVSEPETSAGTRPRAAGESAGSESTASRTKPAGAKANAPAKAEAAAAGSTPGAADTALNKRRIVRFEAYGSDVHLDAKLRDYLDRVKVVLAKSPKSYLSVVGYTDSSGPRQANMAIARKRAAAVASKLKAEDFTADQLRVSSRGPDDPLVPNDSKAHRAENRRVELRLMQP